MAGWCPPPVASSWGTVVQTAGEAPGYQNGLGGVRAGGKEVLSLCKCREPWLGYGYTQDGGGGRLSLTSAFGRRVSGGLGRTCSFMKQSPATLSSSSRTEALSPAGTHGEPARRSQQPEGSLKHVPPAPPSVMHVRAGMFQEASPRQVTRKHHHERSPLGSTGPQP